MYFNPLVLPSWKKRGDRNDYPAIFETHNYIMSLKRKWRDSSGGRPIAAQNNEMALMTVIPQRPVVVGNLPRNVPQPITVPPAGASVVLPTRSIAVGVRTP